VWGGVKIQTNASEQTGGGDPNVRQTELMNGP
jgi:hypothetical protein